MNSYRRVNAASARNMGPLTWCLLQDSCKRSVRNRTLTYVDLTKAFDMVRRDSFRRIMAKYSCPEKFITIVRQYHDGMYARVQDYGESSVTFIVTNGVKQTCVLVPTLFIYHAFSGSDNGINI